MPNASVVGVTTPEARTTVRLALDVFPVPALVEVTVTWFVAAPSVALVPVTFTEKVHEVEGARVAPARLTEVAPAVAVMVPPPQVPLTPLGVATASPPGKLSVKAIPFTVRLVLGLLTTNVSPVTPVTAMVAVPNVLAMVGVL